MKCVACGGATNGTYGKRKEPDALPCCRECYTSGRLMEWLDRSEGNAPTVADELPASATEDVNRGA